MDEMIAAKEARDLIRENLIKELRKSPEGLSPWILQLLAADEGATQTLRQAVEQ